MYRGHCSVCRVLRHACATDTKRGAQYLLNMSSGRTVSALNQTFQPTLEFIMRLASITLAAAALFSAPALADYTYDSIEFDTDLTIYEAHIGGATYAFLRGMEGNAIGDEGHASHALAEPTGASEVTASPAGPSPQSPVPSPQSLFTHRPSAALIDALDRLLSPDA